MTIPGQDYILKCTPLKNVKTILDIGAGSGNASKYFNSKGIKVTATTMNKKIFKHHSSIDGQLHVCDVESLPFEDGRFDAVWMSHVLEHTLNPGKALSEARRVLHNNGWLFVCVPPYKPNVVGGHYMTGWSLGQLIYVLIVSGFNAKQGHFITYKYNVCGFVKKSNLRLPKLKNAKGDIESLKGFWPIKAKHGFNGVIDKINWI